MEAEERYKTGKAWEHLSHNVMWGGRRWGVPNYKFVCNKSEVEFLTGETGYSQSCERRGSRLVMKHWMMKSSALFECGPLPPRPHCVHLMSYSCDRCSQALPLFRSCVLYLTQTKEQRMGGEGEAWE